MRKRRKPMPNALKHGIYSQEFVLPGEDAREFDKLHGALKTELTPNGRLEEDCVLSIAKYVWRKQNLHTLRYLKRVRQQTERAYERTPYGNPIFPTPQGNPQFEVEKATDEVKEERQVVRSWDPEEWDKYFEDRRIEDERMERHLATVRDLTDTDQIVQELEFEAQLDALIDRQLKRLVQLKFMKQAMAATQPRRFPPPPKD